MLFLDALLVILLAVRVQSIILTKVYDFHSTGVLLYDTLFSTPPWEPLLKNLVERGTIFGD